MVAKDPFLNYLKLNWHENDSESVVERVVGNSLSKLDISLIGFPK